MAHMPERESRWQCADGGVWTRKGERETSPPRPLRAASR
jgi:hypothetical protein